LPANAGTLSNETTKANTFMAFPKVGRIPKSMLYGTLSFGKGFFELAPPWVADRLHLQLLGEPMRSIAFGSVALLLLASPAFAQYGNSNRGGYGSGGYGTGSNPNSHSTDGYTTNRGTYVQPYQSTNPNGTQYDNYGTRGNQNPYTGTYGTRTPKR
jgi:hypothetical protein